MVSFVILLIVCTARIACADRHTYRQTYTHETTTVTLSAHTRRGLNMMIVILDNTGYCCVYCSHNIPRAGNVQTFLQKILIVLFDICMCSRSPINQSASQPASQSVSQPASQPASRPVSQPASQPASQSASQPASQSASQSVSQPASQSASQSASQPVSQSVMSLLYHFIPSSDYLLLGLCLC